VERQFARRTQRLIHALSDRINQCADLSNDLSSVIDDLACAPLVVDAETPCVSGLDLHQARSLLEAALTAKAEIRRRVLISGFWSDPVEQAALLRWLVKTLTLAGAPSERVEVGEY
jgi:hypothetical protein